MVKVGVEKQLTVRERNQFGSVERVLEALAAGDVQIHSQSAYHDHNDTVILVIVEDCGPALRALQAAGFAATCTPIIAVQSGYALGVPARLGATLAHAGIGIQYSYATSVNPEELLTVFKTVDDERAIRVLEASMLAFAA